MKTKRHGPQRKHTNHAMKRRHTLATRVRAGWPRLVPPQSRKQEGAAVLCPPLAIDCINAEVCGDELNLVRSTISDEEGSYLVMSIEVPLPFTAAYDAWTRFEDVPHFMRGRHQPACGDGSRMTWRVRTLFDQFAWQAQVCEQVPFEFIAWKSVQGTPHPGFGTVSFEPISHQRTWIMVQIGFDMSGVYRWLGDPLPSLSHSLAQSLKRFHDTVAVQTLDEVAVLPFCLAERQACLPVI